MNNRPLLSIIVPVYNAEPYLRDSVGSILAQTYDNFEIVMVDDGSTDGSLALCEELASEDKRIRVFHKENGGVASARNFGLDKISGDYIGWVDSDDIVSPIMYETMMSFAIEHNADIVQCFHTRETAKLITQFSDDIKIEILNSIESLKRIYRSHYTNSLSLCTKVYKREVFDGIRFTEGTAFEDDEIVPRLVERGQKNVFFDEPMYCYVKHENSIITAPKVKNIMALTSTLEKRMQHFKTLDSELYTLSQKNFFWYIRYKSFEKVFVNTDVQRQAIDMIKKYRKDMMSASNIYDKIYILCLCYGTKGIKNWVLKNEFEPIQKLLQKIKGEK